jgi:hypothetical protein
MAALLRKASDEKRENFVSRLDRRLASLVDQVHRYDIVRRLHDLLVEFRLIGVRSAVGDDLTDKSIAQGCLVSSEPLRLADLVSLEAIRQEVQTLLVEPLFDRTQFVLGDLKPGFIVERQSGL